MFCHRPGRVGLHCPASHRAAAGLDDSRASQAMRWWCCVPRSTGGPAWSAPAARPGGSQRQRQQGHGHLRQGRSGAVNGRLDQQRLRCVAGWLNSTASNPAYTCGSHLRLGLRNCQPWGFRAVGSTRCTSWCVELYLTRLLRWLRPGSHQRLHTGAGTLGTRETRPWEVNPVAWRPHRGRCLRSRPAQRVRRRWRGQSADRARILRANVNGEHCVHGGRAAGASAC